MFIRSLIITAVLASAMAHAFKLNDIEVTFTNPKIPSVTASAVWMVRQKGSDWSASPPRGIRAYLQIDRPNAAGNSNTPNVKDGRMEFPIPHFSVFDSLNNFQNIASFGVVKGIELKLDANGNPYLNSVTLRNGVQLSAEEMGKAEHLIMSSDIKREADFFDNLKGFLTPKGSRYLSAEMKLAQKKKGYDIQKNMVPMELFLKVFEYDVKSQNQAIAVEAEAAGKAQEHSKK